MRSDQVFVLLLIILIPMTGCFDNSVGDAEGAQDSDDSSAAADGTVINNYYNTTSSNNQSQEREWFSSGGTYTTTWTDEFGDQSGAQRCMEYGPLYNSSTGAYIGEECRRYGFPVQESDWNVSECTDVGGTPYWGGLDNYAHIDGDNNNSTNYGYRFAPQCMDIPVLSLTTLSGEAILLYEKTGSFSWTVSCEGVEFTLSGYSLPGQAYSNQFYVVPGSSMSCTHELTRTMQYNPDPSNSMELWSIVYAIQNVTVV